MNKEVIKAMNKKDSKIDQFRRWWRKNGYKVMRVILFPLWFGIVAQDKINDYLNARCVWSDERANQILNYYIPREAEWDNEDKSFYFFDNGIGWRTKRNCNFIKLKDRRWWKNHTGFWGGEIRTYLIEKFELEGFEKIVGNTYDSWTEITFKKL